MAVRQPASKVIQQPTGSSVGSSVLGRQSGGTASSSQGRHSASSAGKSLGSVGAEVGERSVSKLTQLPGTAGSRGSSGSGSAVSGLPPRISPMSDTEIRGLMQDIEGPFPHNVKEKAVGTLCNLTSTPACQKQVLDCGAMSVLIDLINDREWDNITVKEGAAAAVHNVCSTEEGRTVIQESKGIPMMVNMLGDPIYSVSTRHLVMSTLRLLCSSPKAQIETAAVGGIEAFVQVLDSEDDLAETKECAVAVFRSMSYTDERSRINLGEQGALSALVRFMEKEMPKEPTIKLGGRSTATRSPRSDALASAATVLQNLSVYEHNKKYITSAKGIGIMLHVIRESRDPSVQQASSSVLFNLAVNADSRPEIVEEGGVKVLLQLLPVMTLPQETRKFIAGALNHVTQSDVGAEAMVECNGITVISGILASDTNDAVLDHAAEITKTLSQIQKFRGHMIQTAAIPALLDLLRRSSSYGRKEDLLITSLNNLTLGNSDAKVLCADAGGIEVILKLLSFSELTQSATERMSAFLQNLTVAEQNEVDFVEAGGSKMLSSMILNPRMSMKTREFAAGTIQNISVNEENKTVMAKSGVINVLFAVSRDPEASSALLECALGTLQNLSNHKDLKKRLVDSGVVKVVMGLLMDSTRGNTERIKEHAMGTLQNVAVNEDARQQLVSAGAIPLTCRFMNSTVTSIECKQYSAMCLHRICYQQQALITTVKNAGGNLALRRVIGEIPNADAANCLKWTIAYVESQDKKSGSATQSSSSATHSSSGITRVITAMPPTASTA